MHDVTHRMRWPSLFQLLALTKVAKFADIAKAADTPIKRSQACASGAMSLVMCVGCAWEMFERVRHENADWMRCA